MNGGVELESDILVEGSVDGGIDGVELVSKEELVLAEESREDSEHFRGLCDQIIVSVSSNATSDHHLDSIATSNKGEDDGERERETTEHGLGEAGPSKITLPSHTSHHRRQSILNQVLNHHARILFLLSQVMIRGLDLVGAVGDHFFFQEFNDGRAILNQLLVVLDHGQLVAREALQQGVVLYGLVINVHDTEVGFNLQAIGRRRHALRLAELEEIDSVELEERDNQ